MRSFVELVRAAYIGAPAWMRGLYRGLPTAFRTALAEKVTAHHQRRMLQDWVGTLGSPTIVNPPVPEGVTLIGYPRAEFGLGESLRYVAAALELANIPFEVYDFSATSLARQGDERLAHRLSKCNTYATQIFCVSPEHMELVHALLGPSFFAQRRRIAFWYWELPHFPAAWHKALALMDEFWAPTQFIADCLREATDKPVKRIPVPVEVNDVSTFARSQLGIPADTFLFLAAFDMNSGIARKNPAAAIEAFRRAFAAGEKVALVIKTVYGDRHSKDVVSLQAMTAGDPRITVLDAVLSRADMMGLIAASDAYVSLHRAEGFGMLIAEAMALGKPVVVTGYSGNMDFTTAENACLVDYRLVPVREGEYPHHSGQVWADPDVDHAARLMSRVVRDIGFRSQLSARARAEIVSAHSFQITARWLTARLKGVSRSDPQQGFAAASPEQRT